MSVIDFQIRQIHKIFVPLITGTPNTETESVLPEKGVLVYDDNTKELLIGDGTDWFASGAGNQSGVLINTVSGATSFPCDIYWNKIGNCVTLMWRDRAAVTTTTPAVLRTDIPLPDILKPATDPYLIRYLKWPTRVVNGSSQTSEEDGYVSIDFLDMSISWNSNAGSFTNVWSGFKATAITYHTSI